MIVVPRFRPTAGVLKLLMMTLLAALSSATDASQQQEPLDRILEHASLGVHAFDLRVACTSEAGARNFTMYPNRILIWDDQVQLALSAEEAGTLAGILLDGGFSALLPEYGGKGGAQGPGPKPAKAPARVSCSIEVHVDGQRTRSQQYVDGYQSPELHALAQRLLDSVEPLAEQRGAGAESLADGFSKLESGALAAPALELTLTQMKVDGDAGRIMRIEGGAISVRRYTPGRDVGDPVRVPLDGARLRQLARALDQAEISEFPVNLWAENQTELQISLLSHRQSVLARSFMRMTADSEGEAQQRFNALIASLGELADEVLASTDGNASS